MLGTYIWWTVKFSSVENELKRLFYRIKDKLTKIKIKPLHKLFSFIIFLKLLLKLICMTLLHIVTALLTSRFFISNQKSLVFICIKVSKESNNVIEIELETIFVKSNLISPKYFFARHIYGVVLERTFSFFVVAIPFTISLFDEILASFQNCYKVMFSWLFQVSIIHVYMKGSIQQCPIFIPLRYSIIR